MWASRAVVLLNRTPILECYMAKFDDDWGHSKNIFYDKDWSMSSNYVYAILGSRANVFEKSRCDYPNRKRSLFSYISCISTSILKFKMTIVMICNCWSDDTFWYSLNVELVCGVTSGTWFIVFDTKLRFPRDVHMCRKTYKIDVWKIR